MSEKPGPIPNPGPYLIPTPAGEALFLLLRAHRLLFDAIDREFRDGGAFSLALWEVLVVLSLSQGRTRMSDITTGMLVSKSNVTKLVDKLEEAGAVTRERSTSDRRGVYARLTPVGVEVVRRGGDIFNRAAREHLAEPLSSDEIEKVVSGLTKVILANQSPSAE
jgi:DNA-binding MarR family transcriptional regulator